LLSWTPLTVWFIQFLRGEYTLGDNWFYATRFITWQNFFTFSVMTLSWGIFLLTILKMWLLLSERKIVQKNEVGMCVKAITSTLTLICFCTWFSVYDW
jgi:hypothetical protein